jgi:hypothetical protein
MAHRVIRGTAAFRQLLGANRTLASYAARSRDWLLLVHIIPIWPGVRATMAAFPAS